MIVRRLFLFLIVFTLSACTVGEQTTTDPEDDRTRFAVTDALPTGSFGAEGEGAFSGDLYVRGYADIEIVDEPFCTQDCEEFEYIFFEIDETGNESIMDFLPINEGNAYVRPSAIGLGCVKGGIITYNNQSDEFQMKEFTIDVAASRAILESSPESPVTLHLTKLPLTGGSEAPACYAHFTMVEPVEM